jgi:AmmeMemoRadiSam system protein B/AmmeMemoRadiSam system protein A
MCVYKKNPFFIMILVLMQMMIAKEAPVARVPEIFKAHLEGWYPRDTVTLKGLLASMRDKARITRLKEPLTVYGLIVPHAGYRYSGTVASAGYRLLDKQRIKRVLILAPSHFEPVNGIALPFYTTYQTSLGNLTVDTGIVQELAKHELFAVNRGIWSKEHSLEIQLPLVQEYLNPEVQIVPMIVGSVPMNKLKELADALAPYVTPETLIIVSSDFTHYGPRFGFMPFAQSAQVQEDIKALDHRFIDAILHKKAVDVAALLQQTGITVCGAMPILLFKLLQEKNLWPNVHTKLIDYNSSKAVSPEGPDSVSYAAIIFYKQPEVVQAVSAMPSEQDKKMMIASAWKVIRNECNGGPVSPIVNIMIDQTVYTRQKYGVFVTLYKLGSLRGCMGRITPDKPLYALIPEVAGMAAFQDPRFKPVTCDELKDITISISILTDPHPVASYRDIQLGTHGIILRHGSRSALFLPKVATEQGWDLAATLQQLSLKAGLPSNAWQTSEAKFEVFESIDFAQK